MAIAEIQSGNGNNLYRIRFEFQSWSEHTELFVLDLWGDTPSYNFNTGESITYSTCYGVWKYSFSEMLWYFADRGSTHFRHATTRECGIPIDSNKEKKSANIDRQIRDSVKEECGIPHQYLIEDDMEIASSVSRPEAIKKCVEAYAKLMAKHPTPIFTNITEGGNEMTKQLFHVILFNRKTETIDYKAYVAGKDETEVAMTAAHEYKDYDSAIHMCITKHIDGYEKIVPSAAIE